MPVEKKIHVNGVDISYLQAGPADAMPVVFIHGFPFNKSMWTRQLEALDTYCAIAYDVRGHGRSQAGAEALSIELFADDLLAFLDALSIRKAVVCGLSMGGYIALHAIQKQPERFLALLLVDTQCGADTAEGREKRMKTIAFIQKNGLEVYAAESLKNLFAPAAFDTRTEDVQFIHQTILQTPAAVICNTLLALADRQERCTSLPAIQVPVGVVVGSEDKITPPPVAQKMVDAIPNSKLMVIEKAGHLTNLEAPLVFNRLMLEFLKSIPPTS